MEGTPISGAASGWRRWGVCDPSLTQTSWSVFQWRGGGSRGRWDTVFGRFPPNDIIWPPETETHPGLLVPVFDTGKERPGELAQFWLMTETSWRKWEVRGRKWRPQKHHWWRQGLRSLAHAVATQLCASTVGRWVDFWSLNVSFCKSGSQNWKKKKKKAFKTSLNNYGPAITIKFF